MPNHPLTSVGYPPLSDQRTFQEEGSLSNPFRTVQSEKTPSKGRLSRAKTVSSRNLGFQRSSESRKATYSPLLLERPRFLATTCPDGTCLK